MSIVRRLEAGGDIQTSGTQFIYEQASVAQTVSTRLKLFQGEYFRDQSEGTPWFQAILIKNQTEAQRDTLIRRRISLTPHVDFILQYQTDFNLDLREYGITSIVLTEFGEVPINTTGV